ncbi:MAG: DUF4124 domain-containing protein [Piscirickettsiaceae bacterium]|nr:MAG: DUF4124 domain-containing protein [Piscirickettsiaceae bacterium]
MNKIFSIFLAFCFLVIFSQATSAKLYRWKDANGDFYYSDKVPPKDSKFERATLNAEGRTIAIEDAEKTPHELSQLEKIKTIQKLKKALLTKLLAEDSALLKTFQSESDIEALVKSKIETFDSHIKITTSQSNTLKNQLITYQKSAANYERSGKRISSKTLSNIKSAQSQYDKNLADIAGFQQHKASLLNQLERDTARFKLLKKQPLRNPTVFSSGVPSFALGEITCATNQCPTVWAAARNYLEKNANTKLIFESDSLLLTASPKKNSDRNLSLMARTIDDGKTLITLDIYCSDTIQGRQACRNPETSQLATNFNKLNR